ncbi:MAG: AmmeMemoRadiSam system protein B [Treponema sp.]|nr:AmmeMemoRadiSam system protein B [Treponema sp.]
MQGKIHFLIVLVLIISCNKSEDVPVYETWNSLNEMEYWFPVRPVPEEKPSLGSFPWAGITSHHILAHEYLDAYFFYLSQMREIKTFYILSPDHFSLSLQPYSLTNGSWNSGIGLVESDVNKVRSLAKALEVPLDTDVFLYEHGISALMPYIKNYFPSAKVVTIIHGRVPEVNTLISGKLTDALELEFNEAGKQENFLLISADFSHGENREITNNFDIDSRRYLEDTVNVSWNFVCCDNRAGIYILNRLGKKNLKSSILYHTNSWEISGQQEDDITSYFFVFFGDE